MRSVRIQPTRGAIQPTIGAATMPSTAGGTRKHSEDIEAFMPKPASAFWLNTTSVKLMTG